MPSICCNTPAARKHLSNIINFPWKASGCEAGQQHGLAMLFPTIRIGEVICSLLRRGGEVACPAPHAARNLGLAMRSPPNLFLGSVLEDALGKHVSLSKMPAELLFSLASPH